MSYIKVIDTETTGLHSPSIVEIGCCELSEELTIPEEGIYSDLVSTDDIIELGAMCVHNITPEMIEGSPVIEDVIGKYKPTSNTKYIVGHNIEVFDLKVLPQGFIEEGSDVRVLDTLKLARKLVPKDHYGNHKNITLYYGLQCYKTFPIGEYQGVAHRASFDCFMTASILVDLLNRFGMTMDQAYDLIQPDITRCKFKKYSNVPWCEVIKDDESYVEWLLENIEWNCEKEKAYVTDLLVNIKYP